MGEETELLPSVEDRLWNTPRLTLTLTIGEMPWDTVEEEGAATEKVLTEAEVGSIEMVPPNDVAEEGRRPDSRIEEVCPRVVKDPTSGLDSNTEADARGEF